MLHGAQWLGSDASWHFRAERSDNDKQFVQNKYGNPNVSLLYFWLAQYNIIWSWTYFVNYNTHAINRTRPWQNISCHVISAIKHADLQRNVNILKARE